MELIGRIKLINPEQQVSPTYKKREIVITTDSQFPQHILIEFSQDKCDLLNNFAVGQNVKVDTNILGREWLSPSGETKYFNSIKGWRIFEENVGSQAPQQPQSAVEQYEAKNTPVQVVSGEDEPDDLPF